MTKRIFTYILLILSCAAAMVSCAADDTASADGGGRMREFRGTLVFSLSTPDVALRTRTVSTGSGAPIQVDNLWIGIFDTTTGACFGAKRYDDWNRVMMSGSVMKDMLNVDFVAYGENIPLAYIVAVANYDGVTTWSGRRLTDILPDFNDRASITWDDMVNLDIDTASAYAGSKGEDENANAPFMAGFFQDATSLTQIPKIDQFSYSVLGPGALYPEAAAEGMDIQLGDAQSDQIYVAAGAICLRRLVSHNTVRLNMSNGYEVTAVKYRRFNMPRAVYMLQRRTDTERRSDFAEWQRLSPNFADRLLTEGPQDRSDAAFPYADDEEWISLEVNYWDDRENVEFAFDHFENKHWGFGQLDSQDDREARNPDGTFAALCSGAEDAWNDFASYFVLRLHLVNRTTGENADVEYTLHEGFCNDADGRRASTLKEKCRDFTSLRNVSYTYNVNISGTGDISASVTSDDGPHPNGQQGSIWKMNFATGSSRTPAAIGGGVYDCNGSGITFSSHPDLGFRIYGRDDEGGIVDVCYNMPEGMLEGFGGLWPAGQPVVVQSPDDAAIPQSLLGSMLIGNDSGYHTLTEFVQGVAGGTIDPTGRFGISFASYEGAFAGMTGNFMRGIYIFDRHDTHNAVDADGCSSVNIAYGAVQYPFAPERITFDPDNIRWDNTYYRSVTTVTNLFAATTPIFYGSQNSVIELRWRHDPRISGYRISVYNDSYTHPTIVAGPDKIDRYLHKVKDETLFIYPLNTASFPNISGNTTVNYSIAVTPIVDEDIYEPGGTTRIEPANNANCIRMCSTVWDIASAPDWKAIELKGLKGGIEAHYRGFNIFSTTNVDNYGVKGSYICFGGGGSTVTRHFYFRASVPGRFAVTCKSHSGSDDPARQLIVSRMNGETGEVVYESKTMSGSSTTYTTGMLYLNDNAPTEFRIYTAGSVDFYKFQFLPAN